MATFRYSGRTPRGDTVTGVLEAESPESLADHLFARGVTPTDIQQTTGSQDVLQDIGDDTDCGHRQPVDSGIHCSFFLRGLKRVLLI